MFLVIQKCNRILDFPCNQLTFGNPCYKRLLMLLHWFIPINEEKRLIIRERKSRRRRQSNEPRTRKRKDWLYGHSWRFLEMLEGRLLNFLSTWKLQKKITHVITYTMSLWEQWITTKEHTADDLLNLSPSTQVDGPGDSCRKHHEGSILKCGVSCTHVVQDKGFQSNMHHELIPNP